MAARDGLKVKMNDGSTKILNLIVLFVPDLSCLYKIMGRTDGMCGDAFCTKPTALYGPNQDRTLFPLRSVKSMVKAGERSVTEKARLIFCSWISKRPV